MTEKLFTGTLRINIPTNQPSCAVDQVGSLQNDCRPRIKAFDRAVTVNDSSDYWQSNETKRLSIHLVDSRFLHVWYKTDSVDSRFLHVWYTTDSVDSRFLHVWYTTDSVDSRFCMYGIRLTQWLESV